MTDPMELAGRLEAHADVAVDGIASSVLHELEERGMTNLPQIMQEMAITLTEAAACIREMVEEKDRYLEAAFMWAWARGAGTFLQDPDGLAEWRAYRRSALRTLPPAPGAEA